MRASRTLFLMFLVAALTLGGKQPLDLDDTSFDFPSATAKTGAKAKKIGKLGGVEFKSFELTLKPGGLWEAELDGGPFASGSYTRKNEFSKKLKLTLDPVSVATVADFYEDEMEAAAANQGVFVDAALTLSKQSIRAALKTSKKKGTVTAKLAVKFALVGTATGGGQVNTPAKVRSRIKGVSNTLPLVDILVP